MNPAEDPHAIGTWVLVAFAVLTGLGTLLQIVAFFRPKPPLHETYATKAELEKLEQRLAQENRQLHGRISGLRDDLTKSGEERAVRIIEAVDNVNRRLAHFERDIGRIESGLEHLKSK